jgi:hypothetical protein
VVCLRPHDELPAGCAHSGACILSNRHTQPLVCHG